MNATKPRLLAKKSMRQRIRENEMALSYAKVAHDQVLRANMMVCALLAQAGGEMTVTQGTLDQCVALIDTLGYEMEETVPGKEYRLRMLVGNVAAAPPPIQTIGYVEPTRPPAENNLPNIVITGL